MKDLKKDIENSLSRQYKWLNHIENDFENADPMSLNFRFLERDWAVYEILNRNISKAKQHFCTASLLDKLRIEKFNNNMFDYGDVQPWFGKQGLGDQVRSTIDFNDVRIRKYIEIIEQLEYKDGKWIKIK